MRILTVSDVMVQLIYSPCIRQRFDDVKLAISCGDLPYYYLEYLISMLDIPLFFVRGNHDKVEEYSHGANRDSPAGGIDIHLRTEYHHGLILAGVEGSIRYRHGPFMYSQTEMWWNVFRLVPKLLINRVKFGRYLDIFVTHAPPRGIHDQQDYAHQGISAFLWLDKVFKPKYHFHGHIHVYRNDQIIESLLECTQVVNTYGYRKINFS